jgi:rhodanese-related sulfurtransferase
MELMDKPKIQSFHLNGVKHVSPDKTWELIEKKAAVLVDVRENHECAVQSVDSENVIYIPMSNFMSQLESLPKDKTLAVFCKEGIRSTKIANLLMIQGFSSVFNVDGGMFAWKKKGLPIESIFDGDGCHDCNGDCSNC